MTRIASQASFLVNKIFARKIIDVILCNLTFAYNVLFFRQFETKTRMLMEPMESKFHGIPRNNKS